MSNNLWGKVYKNWLITDKWAIGGEAVVLDFIQELGPGF
jgi:hypothetical protein